MTETERIPILTPEQEEDRPIKLILVGDYGSGKSSLLHRHISNTFKENQQFTKKTKVKLNIKIKEKRRTLLISDTNGEEKYQSIQAYA